MVAHLVGIEEGGQRLKWPVSRVEWGTFVHHGEALNHYILNQDIFGEREKTNEEKHISIVCKGLSRDVGGYFVYVIFLRHKE